MNFWSTSTIVLEFFRLIFPHASTLRRKDKPAFLTREVVFILDLLGELEVSEMLELKRPGPKAHLFELFSVLTELIASSSVPVRNGVQKLFGQIQRELQQ